MRNPLPVTLSENDSFRQALTALQAGDVKAAEPLFRAVLRRQPKHVAALNLLGIVLMQLGRFEEADDYLRRALAENPGSDTTLYNRGIVLKALDRPAEALECFTRASMINAAVAETWNNRGTVLNDLHRFEEALEDFERAISLNPGYAEAHCNKGNALTGLDRLEEASSAFEGALALNPNLAEAWLGRGNIYFERKRYNESLGAFERARAFKPALPEAWIACGKALCELRRHDEAVSAYDQALARAANNAEAWLGRGNALNSLGRHDQALAAFAKALKLKPELADAWLGRGNVFHTLKRYGDALAAFEKALALKQDLAQAWLGRGNVYCDLKRWKEALAAYDQARALDPGLAETWFGAGNVACMQGRYDEAIASYDKAIALKPDFAEAWYGRGNVLRINGRRSEASAAIDQALTLKPDLAAAWVVRAIVLFEANRPQQALAAVDKALSIEPDHAEAISARIFILDFVDAAGFKEQQEARRYWWQHVGLPIASTSQPHHTNTRDPRRPIKVGYVSADFRNHSAGFSFRPVLLNHDKAQFEITCYSSCHVEDEFTRDFRRAADRWRDVAQVSDDELAAQIQADQIDILVDLSGHSEGNRLKAFARKPAPVQVTAWGHATGTGLPTIDYLFSDPVACPAAVRSMFAEKIFDLPCLVSIDPLPEGVPPSDPPALSKGYVTFGVFNRANKISDVCIAAWARILDAVPRSRLLMKHFAFDDASVRSRQLERFAAHGIAPDRLAFLGATSRQEHLAAYREVDICLDTFPQNGGVSTWESIQTGVPVIAVLGNRIASRVAGAILSAVGMQDWVSESLDGYVAIAEKFSARPDDLKALRHALPARLSASTAGNGSSYAKAVEAAYRTIWGEYCRSDGDA